MSYSSILKAFVLVISLTFFCNIDITEQKILQDPTWCCIGIVFNTTNVFDSGAIVGFESTIGCSVSSPLLFNRIYAMYLIDADSNNTAPCEDETQRYCKNEYQYQCIYNP
eukprot:TRINITY_DN2136_c1_g1_i1.p1 TRINITY_DN2136_c1_g1~~TRINITY_DN2136_c1_g1_i1.p1  ORF type:complete len:120 (+),score=19.77 TRINITY_DN2136_c1_g1_i1:31-360(+)